MADDIVACVRIRCPISGMRDSAVCEVLCPIERFLLDESLFCALPLRTLCLCVIHCAPFEITVRRVSATPT